MAHAPFTQYLKAPWYNNGVFQANCTDAFYATEACSGARRVKPAGWIPPVAYSFVRNCYQRHDGVYYYRSQHNSDPWVENVDYSGCIGIGTGTGLESLGVLNAVYASQGVPTSFRDRALIKARLAMKDQSVNLGVAFAERNKTAQLIGTTAIRIANAARHLMHGSFKKAARDLGIKKPRKPRGNSIHGQWLELQYGWLPLLSDCYGSVEALAKRDKSDWIVTGKGSVKEPIAVDRITSSVSSISYGHGKASGTRGVYVRIDAIPQNDMLLNMNSLGLTNPLTIAWELVPFSFVVDWFLPVGSFVDSMDAMLGYGPTWCSISTLERFRVSHRLMSSNYKTGSGLHIYTHDMTRSGSAHREYVSLIREALTSVPLPLLPRFKDPRSLAHMANGLALLASVFSRKR